MRLRFAAPLLALALVGCPWFMTSELPETGTLEVVVTVDPDLLETNNWNHMVEIAVEAKHPNDDYENSKSTNLPPNSDRKVTKTFEGVPAVEAKVTATAKKDGKEVAKTTRSVSVGASKTTTIQLALPPED